MEFFVTGSFAVNYYTGDRRYSDIDFVIRPQDFYSWAEKLKVAPRTKISKFGEPFRVLEIGNMEFADYVFNKYGKEYNLGFIEDISEYKEIEFSGMKVKVSPVENLIALKLFLNRNEKGKKDFSDCIDLIKNVEIDWNRLIALTYKYQIVDRFYDLIQEPFLKKQNIKQRVDILTPSKLFTYLRD